MNRAEGGIREYFAAGLSVREASERLGMRRTDVAAAYQEIAGGEKKRRARLTAAERREVQRSCSVERAMGAGADLIAGHSLDCGREVGRQYNAVGLREDGTEFVVGGFQTKEGRVLVEPIRLPLRPAARSTSPSGEETFMAGEDG